MYNIISKFGLPGILSITVLFLAIAGFSYQSSGSVDLLMNLAYVLIFGAVSFAVVLPLINALKNPKVLVRAGIGIGTLAAIYGISYAQENAQMKPLYERLAVSIENVQIAGALVQMTLVLIVIAVAAVILGELSKAIK